MNVISAIDNLKHPQGADESDLRESINTAIIALEKHMPKKPYIQQDDMNNDCIECSSCDSFIGYEYDCRDEHYQINYCPYCGQAIDWGVSE